LTRLFSADSLSVAQVTGTRETLEVRVSTRNRVRALTRALRPRNIMDMRREAGAVRLRISAMLALDTFLVLNGIAQMIRAIKNF
jgi:hypothetical protein